jgi:methylated-DNA-protein-cysteine methyltransferase related protein
MSSAYDQVYAIVCRIPKGKVLTYGLISNLINSRLSAQGVGWAMQALAKNPNKPGKYNATNVPWHRVINSQGKLSTHKNPNILPGLQKKLLEKEGIKFDSEEKMDLPSHLWKDGLLEKY